MKRYWINVNPEMNWFFFKFEASYDVLEEYDHCSDPTYGNGGGEWIKRSRKLRSFSNMLDAKKYRDMLNELEEDNARN